MNDERPELTPIRITILDFIEAFAKFHGWAPTIREIGLGVGLSSTSSVQHHLKVLTRDGYLARPNHTSYRAMAVVR